MANTPAPDSSANTPDLANSQPGNYLAALVASNDRDTAAAEAFYRAALKVDPRNTDLLARAFAATLSNGDQASASAIAERLIARDPNNSMARLMLAVHAIQQGQYAAARAQLTVGDSPRSRDVTTALLIAWCYAGQSDLRHALDTLDRVHDPAVAAFRDYHAGLIADLLANPVEARRRLKSAYDSRQEQPPLRRSLRPFSSGARRCRRRQEGLRRLFRPGPPPPDRRAGARESQCRQNTGSCGP